MILLFENLRRVFDKNSLRAFVSPRLDLVVELFFSQAQGFAIDPAFPPFHVSVIALTDQKLINTFLSTIFKAVKIEKCHMLSATTITLSILKTLSITIPLSISLTALPPMMIPKY